MSEEKRTALVTGASGGIGRAIAESLGAGGYRVAVNYNANERGACETVAAISATGGEAIAIQADVSRRTDCERLFARIEASERSRARFDNRSLRTKSQSSCLPDSCSGSARSTPSPRSGRTTERKRA